MTATELLLGALGTGGTITMLVQILRDWVARYRIKALSVRLPEGTNIQIADASIDSVERLFIAIGAHQRARSIRSCRNSAVRHQHRVFRNPGSKVATHRGSSTLR